MDENMLEQVVTGLRSDGHDVSWVNEFNRGDLDINHLEYATRDRRTLITYDKDFGDLVHRDGESAPYGVLLFRIHDALPDDIEAKFIIGSVNSADEWPSGVWTIQIRHRE